MYAVKRMYLSFDSKLPAVARLASVYRNLFNVTYLLAIAIATLGWLWFLAWCTMELMT